ncbi:uncharacterized protein MONOS_14255 [Monocercomonoides exilis]|uniref:uncharacterized protein n=1 Tax=Monocercomonoides exilis TaxID=2049356 RepID=UPI003559BEB0|nr:hypothetical protein MONOS_14255 [Monocercomonoides exilis]
MKNLSSDSETIVQKNDVGIHKICVCSRWGFLLFIGEIFFAKANFLITKSGFKSKEKGGSAKRGGNKIAGLEEHLNKGRREKRSLIERDHRKHPRLPGASRSYLA